jgi:glycogen(starch) synthase
MRLLVISDLYPPVAFGGYERECATVVRHLATTHDVRVLTSDKDREGRCEPSITRELPSIWGRRKREIPHSPIVAARGAAVTRRVLEEFRPDLVYVWGVQTISHSPLAVIAERGVPTAYRFCVPFSTQVYAGDRFFRYLGPPSARRGGAWGALMRLANRLPPLRFDAQRPARASIAWVSDALRFARPVSRAVEPVLERTIWPATQQAERLAVLPRRPTGRPTFAYIGRVVPDKGPEIAYRALAALRDHHGIDADLLVAGWCPPEVRASLDGLAGELGIAGRITMRGQLEGSELDAVYQQADVVLVPSLVWEGLGLVAIEAALARAPVVASRVGGLPEALRDRRDALLFPPGDAGACASALAETLRDESATARRVDSAFQRAREEFSVDRYLARTESFLADTLAAW